jgi:uncharacterized damage-inducible protein DinB
LHYGHPISQKVVTPSNKNWAGHFAPKSEYVHSQTRLLKSNFSLTHFFAHKENHTMPKSIHDYLAQMTRKAADTLVGAYLALPEEKRHWQPSGTARSAADMMAECAVMNDTTDLIATRGMPADFEYAAFQKLTAELAQDEARLLTLFRENTERGIAALKTVPESDLDIEVPLPWATYTLGQIIAYPFWNMSYHEGQINYIASL